MGLQRIKSLGLTPDLAKGAAGLALGGRHRPIASTSAF